MTTATGTLLLHIHPGTRAPLPIHLSPQSCWTNLLGHWPLPADGSLDTLAHEFEHLRPEHDITPPSSITLEGCPSAALLPMLWLRSIWLTPQTPIDLHWTTIQPPTQNTGQQAAGRLACLLARHVRCDNPAQAESLWGWSTSTDRLPHRDLAEAFDLLTNIIDVWGASPGHATQSAGWAQAARRAMETCASLGHRRIALYGAGTHTRALGDVLAEPQLDIVGIIDDDPRRHGQRLWGYPIISPAHALELKPDAIILSANSVEDLLWERTAPHRAAGICVTRLYGESAPA